MAPINGRTAWIIVLLAAALALVWWAEPGQWSLPLCGFHALTGLHCPGCGAIRATHELLHGRLLSALQYNALWVVSLPLVAWMAVCLLRRQKVQSTKYEVRSTKWTWFWVWAAAAVILFGVLRNIPVDALRWLAPPG